MKRRNFLRTAGALSLPALLKGGIAAAPAELFTQFLSNDNDRVLVLVQLAGGNDGLNTLIGLDQLSNLQAVRPNVALSTGAALNLNATVGLHPAMTGMSALFQEGKLGVVQAVGYPNQNRSHFRSTDIWTSASNYDELTATGWLGRHLDEDHPTYPDNYPNADFADPLAITMGNVISETCQGTQANYSIAVNNPNSFTYIAPGGNTPLPDNYYGDEVDFIRSLIGQSNVYGSIVTDAAQNGSTLANNYTGGSLSNQLRNIALLLSGGLKTRIFIATLGGFDTHSSQVAGNTSAGTHADLLAELSGSIKAFSDDLTLLGLSQRVMGLTFSEFGRRIRSNGSNGTDHGDASPLFLFGDCVQGGVLGNNPVINTSVGQNVGVPFQYDFRDVYGSVLVDWFDVPQATVSNLISGGFNYLPIANACGEAFNVELLNMTARGMEKEIWVDWSTSRETDNAGFTIERSEDGRNFQNVGRVAAQVQGESVFNEYHFVDTNVRIGPLYYYRLRQEDFSGDFEYSPIQTARLHGTAQGDWAVGLPQPNPVRDDSYIQVYAPTDSTASFELFATTGQRLRTGTLVLPGRVDTRIPLNPTNLPAGTYTWRLTVKDGQQFVRKLIK